MIDEVFKVRFSLISGMLVLTVVGCKTPAGIESKTGPDQLRLVEVWRTPGTNQLPQCQPHLAKLVGTIKNDGFPGPPNYDDSTKNPEDYWILKLAHPIDVAEDPDFPAPDENKPQLNVREVQLNLDYNAYRQYLNRRVIVVGKLMQGFTVHHKTAVLINVQDIQGVE